MAIPQLKGLLFTLFFMMFLMLLSSAGRCSYKGSHAYNHTRAFSAQVNTATGTFDFSYPVLQAQGVLAPLKINLTYSFNASGMYGLPNNWRLNLDHINNKTAELGGQQWLIDFLWHDESGFFSGLKYYNQHGSSFKDNGCSQPVPGYPQLSFRYRSQHKDGGLQYFSSQGLLILQADRFGNSVQYSYEEPIATLESARLAKIVDNYGNVYRFIYEPGTLIIRYPDGRELNIMFNETGVIKIVNPLKQNYHITYLNKFDHYLIRSIESPEGLLTELSYDSIFYKKGKTTKEMPVVSHFKQQDLADQKIHHEAYYRYGKSNNYTGYPTYRLSRESDSLMESNDQDYRYSVEVIRANGQQLHQQVFEYNSLHLPAQIRTTHLGKPYLKTTYEYSISPFKYSRSTNYDKPVAVTHYLWHDGHYVPSDKTTTNYDNYGNKLSVTRSVYDRQAQQWNVLKKSASKYFINNYSLLAEHIQADLISGKAIRKSYLLAPSGKTHASELLSWKPHHQSLDWQSWQQKNYTHDELGRKRSSTLKWVATSKPGIQSAKKSTNYHFNKANGELTITKLNDSGHKMTTVMDTRNGQQRKTIAPEGEVVTYTYDALNRKITQTDPKGNVTHSSYSAFIDSGENTVTHRSPLGNQHRIVQDASGRSIARQDLHQGKWRTLSSQTYNGFGKIVSKTDILGLTTTFTYDDQSRRTQTKDHWGNVHRIEYDDKEMVSTVWINGRKRQTTGQVPWQRKRIIQKYPVLGNTEDTPTQLVENEVVHDAFHNKIIARSTLVDLSSKARSETITHTYQHDARHNRIALTTDTWDGYKASRTQEFDLFNHLYIWRKTLKTPEHISNHEGYRYHYNRDGLLAQIESPPNNDGESLYLKYGYDKNGREIKRTLADGQQIHSRYDSRGKLTSKSWNRNQKRYEINGHYDADGRLTQMRDNSGQSMQYRYTTNGLMIEIKYPDDRLLSYTLDEYDRIIALKNVDQRQQYYTYATKDNGLLSNIRLGDSRIDFHYGKDENGLNGRLIKQTTDSAGTGRTETRFHYGSHGQLAKSSSFNQRTQAYYNTSYQHKPRGELSTQSQQLKQQGKPLQTQVTEYEYDSMQRLTDERQLINSHQKNTKKHHRRTRYHYDGNNNLIAEEIRSPCSEKRQYDYDKLDQLVSVRVNDASNSIPVLHNANGRLQQDHTGTTYEYDDAGFLLRLQPKNQQPTHYEYLPNGMLSRTVTGALDNRYYPDNNKNIQTVSQNHRFSTLLRSGAEIIAVQTEQAGTDQLFKLNQSTGATLQQGDRGETHFNLHRYDAYGKPLDPNHVKGVSGYFGWNQELTEPRTHLTYLRHRFYSPLLRRFISRDDIAVDNRYAFARGNPVNYVDPSGHNAVANYITGGIFAVVGAIGFIAAVPTGGASLSLSAASGAGASLSGLISGVSLIGSQGALDTGNKTEAKSLSITSYVFDALAGLDFVVSVAPKIASFSAKIAKKLMGEVTAIDDYAESTGGLGEAANLTNEKETSQLQGNIDFTGIEPDPVLVANDIWRATSYKVDNVEMKGMIKEFSENSIPESEINNKLFASWQVHQGLMANTITDFSNTHPGWFLGNVIGREVPLNYEIMDNSVTISSLWHIFNQFDPEQETRFNSSFLAEYHPDSNSMSWSFDYPSSHITNSNPP